ncbi:hypothetical protein BOO69_20300 (plasmid) [Sulfitobacter alexandrii]|uniref:DUF3237 domain-containing protein n=2 Tax=Sulfitobacter alexandrii TaxID=1917485 RepID=A0A1J0WNL8_9RHOB|nr:hypothetical protein BOO69_20300 [Sulfitobacter alexandrii]
MTTLGAPLSPGMPRLTRVCSIRAEIGPAMEFDTSRGTGRAIFPITGGAAVGAGWQATILPGGADFARRLADGTYEIEARYFMRLDDGTLVMVQNAGRMVPQKDGSFHGRTRAELEVPEGAMAHLGDMVLFGTAYAPSDDEERVYIELWHAEV